MALYKGTLPNMDNVYIDLKNDYKLKIAFDEDMIELYDFLIKQEHSNIHYTNPISNALIDTQLQLRSSIFNMNALVFCFYIKKI